MLFPIRLVDFDTLRNWAQHLRDGGLRDRIPVVKQRHVGLVVTAPRRAHRLSVVRFSLYPFRKPFPVGRPPSTRTRPAPLPLGIRPALPSVLTPGPRYDSPAIMAGCAEVQSIRDMFAAARATNRPVVSLEFFPPKDEHGERTLFEETIPALRQLQPDFCSVTCGAGGSTSLYTKTLQTVDRIQREHQLTSMAHLTCVNKTREQLAEILNGARQLGIKNILAPVANQLGQTGQPRSDHEARRAPEMFGSNGR